MDGQYGDVDQHYAESYDPSYDTGDHSQQYNQQAQGNGIASSKVEDTRKMFVGGISMDTTTSDLRDYFSRYGTVLDCTLKIDPVTGRSRGFGFVLFNEATAVDKVLAEKVHILKGKTIDPKRALLNAGKEPIKKIFVGGVDPNITEEEVRSYFSRYGKVESVELPFDRTQGKRRGFCFVTFDTEESVDRAVSVPRQKVGNKECDLKKAMTKTELVAAGIGRGANAAAAAGMPGAPAARGRGRGRGAPGGFVPGQAPAPWTQGAAPGATGGEYDYSQYYGQAGYGYGTGYDYGTGYPAGADFSGYPGYDYSQYYAGQAAAGGAAAWPGYGQGAAYNGAAGYGAPPQQQPSNFGKAKRGAPAAGAAPTFHPYQR